MTATRTDSAPNRYRKLPVVIEAIQWNGTTPGATTIIDWIISAGGSATYRCSDPDRCAATDGDTPHAIVIQTLEGPMRAGLGDWVLRGIAGEFYPVKEPIFRDTYEPVDGDA
jgi:hypothetical protein